tara:strand:+ start:747 stop:995 length:249 start_codon:yes stop_codon:yes gene_type:complete
MQKSSGSITVRLFAGLRERAGWGEQPWPLQSGADAVSVWQALGFGDAIPDGTRVAINQQFQSPQQPLQQGDELAFLPPISGG